MAARLELALQCRPLKICGGTTFSGHFLCSGPVALGLLETDASSCKWELIRSECGLTASSSVARAFQFCVESLGSFINKRKWLLAATVVACCVCAIHVAVALSVYGPETVSIVTCGT